jgi:integrase/recombinase XerD
VTEADGEATRETEYTALDAVIDGYLIHLKVERNVAKNTLEAYSRDLRDFADAMVELEKREPKGIDTESIATWARSLAQAGLKPRSQARMIVAVRGLFRHLLRTHVVDADPAKLVELPKAGRPLPQLVSIDEIVELLKVCPTARDRALILLLYGAGMRVSEVVNLELGALQLDAGVLRVLGKGNKERAVPIGSPVIDGLRTWLDGERAALLKGAPNDLVFPGRNRRRPLTRQAVFELLRRLARDAGITRDISPHKLRHGFATDLVRGGADLRSVQVMLGHADLRTTEIYTHVDDEHLRRTYDKTHPRS